MLALCMLSFSAFAQKTKNTTANFWVAGACGMCETTIEKAVDVKGVVAYDYNLTTHRLEITFNPTKITLDKIHSLIKHFFLYNIIQKIKILSDKILYDANKSILFFKIDIKSHF